EKARVLVGEQGRAVALSRDGAGEDGVDDELEAVEAALQVREGGTNLGAEAVHGSLDGGEGLGPALARFAVLAPVPGFVDEEEGAPGGDLDGQLGLHVGDRLPDGEDHLPQLIGNPFDAKKGREGKREEEPERDEDERERDAYPAPPLALLACSPLRRRPRLHARKPPLPRPPPR